MNFSRFTISKKNSCPGNYMRKYGSSIMLEITNYLRKKSCGNLKRLGTLGSRIVTQNSFGMCDFSFCMVVVLIS